MTCRQLKAWFCFAIVACFLASCTPEDPRLTSAVVSSENTAIGQRQTLMQEAHRALAILVDMAGGQQRFRVDQARLARRKLISATRDIPRVFRKQQTSELSHAKLEIWANWDDFSDNAATAEKAAKALRANSSNGLRRTLQDMIHTCLACHQLYRAPGPRRP